MAARRCWILVFVVASAVGRLAAAAPVRIDLGGPREAVVTVAEDGERYRLEVDALAVQAFDGTNNREANATLARSFALTALTRHLQLAPTQQLSLGGVEAGPEVAAGRRFTMAFTVPRAAVKVVERNDGAATNLRLDPEFAPYLTADPLLMEMEGAKIVKLDAGLERTADEPVRVLVLGVASSVLKDGSAADRKRAETVARNRAYAHIVAEKTGVQVARSETLDKKVVVTIEEDGRETGSSVSEYLETTRADLQGRTRAFPVVGRWTSPDGTLFYVAVGGILEPAAAR